MTVMIMVVVNGYDGDDYGDDDDRDDGGEKMLIPVA